MAGYAYPVGAAGAEYPSTTATAQINSANSAVTVFTATKKTRINSVLVANDDFGILPVKIYINGQNINSVRVLKTKYAILPLTSNGGRTDDPADPTTDRNKVNVEVVLLPGDVLQASCPVANAVFVTASLSEGVK